MPNDLETVKLLQQMLEELQKNREYREQLEKSLSGIRPNSSEEHQRRMREIGELRKDSEQKRQEDLAYRAQLLGTLDRLIEVISAVSTKLDKQAFSPD
jgi:hypothetical protein